jgi:hypothetical protein
MPLHLLSNSYALLIAGLLAISSSVGQSENRAYREPGKFAGRPADVTI